MGEAPIRGNVSHGDGVYKSTDAGQDVEERRASRRRARSRACASTRRTPTSSTSPRSATRSGPNPERGVFRSKDGGKTWEKVLFVDDKTGAVDLVDGPDEPARPLRRLLAGRTASRGRSRAAARAAASASRPTAATPGTKLTRNGPARGDRRQDRASRSRRPAPSASGRIIEAEDGGRLPLRRRRRDVDARRTSERKLRQRAWYYTHIYADPKNAETRLRPERRASTARTTAARRSRRSACRTATTTTSGSPRTTRSG